MAIMIRVGERWVTRGSPEGDAAETQARLEAERLRREIERQNYPDPRDVHDSERPYPERDQSPALQFGTALESIGGSASRPSRISSLNRNPAILTPF
jgi:hypothetical protein